MKVRFVTTLLVLFGLFSCETEPVNNREKENNELSKQDVLYEEHGYVNSEDIPEVVNILGKVVESPSGNGKMIEEEGAIIDLNTIVMAKGGEDGKTNYTFPIFTKNQPESEFYNLIVPVDENGNTLKPYVRRYVVNQEHMDEYRSSGYDFQAFNGRFYRYSYSDFFEALKQAGNKGTMRNSDCDDDGTPIGGGGGGSSSPIENPDMISVDGTNPWAGGGDSYLGWISFPSWSAGTSNQDYDVGANVNDNYRDSEQYAEVVSTYGIAHINYGSTIAVVDWSQVIATNVTVNIVSGGTDTDPSAPCIAKITRTTKYVGGLVITVTEYVGCEDIPNQKGRVVKSGRNGDCDDGNDGNVGIINIGVIINLKNKLGLEVGSAPYQWLLANPTRAVKLNSFIVANTSNGILDPEARELAITALTAVANGEEYPSCESFEYSVVVDGGGWITAGVSGVWDIAVKWGRCPGIALGSFSEPLYFQLPGYYGFEEASNVSAFYLWSAFENWGNWYRRTYNKDCVSDWNPAIRERLMTEIKESFQEIGGRVDRVPPLGYNGVVRPYKESGIDGDFICF